MLNCWTEVTFYKNKNALSDLKVWLNEIVEVILNDFINLKINCFCAMLFMIYKIVYFFTSTKDKFYRF